jgi:N-acetylglucosaminyl-diphospho-decaprenol L-rhamnosyltransferase
LWLILYVYKNGIYLSRLNMITKKNIIFSIVSHGQLGLIKDFLEDFKAAVFDNVSIVLTVNIPEDESVLLDFDMLPISLIRNAEPKGFGANHNFALLQSSGDVFVIVNPDIRLKNFNLDILLETLEADDVGASAPVVLSSQGTVEDSVRRFPTLSRLLRRIIFGQRQPDYQWSNSAIQVDWSAGMFVAFRPEAFRSVGGFDERFFMYYEDADICRRLARSGWKTILQPATSVVHDAQRASRRSRQHMQWHLKSMFRFLMLS